jgi:hypothetical protein
MSKIQAAMLVFLPEGFKKKRKNICASPLFSMWTSDAQAFCVWTSRVGAIH